MTAAIFAQDIFQFDVVMRNAEIVTEFHSIDQLQEDRLDELVIADVNPVDLHHVEDVALWEIVQHNKYKVRFVCDPMKHHDIWMV